MALNKLKNIPSLTNSSHSSINGIASNAANSKPSGADTDDIDENDESGQSILSVSYTHLIARKMLMLQFAFPAKKMEFFHRFSLPLGCPRSRRISNGR